PVVRLHPLDFFVPEAGRHLGPFVVDGLRVAHLARRPGPARELPGGPLLSDHEVNRVDLALRAEVFHLHGVVSRTSAFRINTPRKATEAQPSTRNRTGEDHRART